jgi:hypothetical protein
MISTSFSNTRSRNPTAPALRKLATGGTFDPGERAAVALFVALTAARSPEKMNGVITEYLGGLALTAREKLAKRKGYAARFKWNKTLG